MSYQVNRDEIRHVASHQIYDYLGKSLQTPLNEVQDKITEVSKQLHREQESKTAEKSEEINIKVIKPKSNDLTQVELDRKQASSSVFKKWKRYIDLTKKNTETTIHDKTIFSNEHRAIYLYSTNHYLLINGTLDRDETSINMWLKFFMRKKKDELGFFEKGKFRTLQNTIPEISQLLASAINKLPPYEGIIYRGDAIPTSELESWKEGKALVTSKFFSCSTDASTCERFARNSAIDYMKNLQVEYKPVLYVIDSKNSKDISPYVRDDLQSESERIYVPGQIFKGVHVDEATVPGLAIIHLQEIENDDDMP